MNLTLENKQPLMPSIPELTNSSVSLGECEQLTTPHSWGAKHLITKPNVFTEVVSLFKLMVRSITGRAAHQPLDKPCTESPAAPFPSQQPIPLVKCIPFHLLALPCSSTLSSLT